jgi:UDP-2,3-diacylglucosamine pyrophosphatase LpxH
MITNICEQRLLVVSDTHLGNPLFKSRKRFVKFLRYAWMNSWNVCINGDGVDIVQTTISRITRDLSECAIQLRRFGERGLRVYYTVGNHDIILENFLDDWEIVCVVPFLNVTSGDRRIRIEHGHLYDKSYVNYPTIFHLATWMGGVALQIHPRCYKMFERWKPLVEKTGRLLKKNDPVEFLAGCEDAESIAGEPACYRPVAEEIARHGFDTVIFGHTHLEGQIGLSTGATYINTGSWLFEPHYAEIDHGQVTLKRVGDLDGMVSS